MKTIILIGDQANANRFTTDLKMTSRDQYRVADTIIKITYQSAVEKVITQPCSAIVVVTTANRRIPDSVTAYLPRLARDKTFTYTQENTPMNFLQGMMHHLQPVAGFRDKVRYMLFGAETPAKASRHMKLQLATRKHIT